MRVLDYWTLSVVCIDLESWYHWPASIGQYHREYYINADHWTTKLSYVCQYHSKSLYGLSLVSLSVSRYCWKITWTIAVTFAWL